ncbi:hypothetical protein ACIQ9P_26680 [Kitasatospora sp. NPDC094019]|uniref:hypothetical protein n=1 Tax=Kitasatospora sp. NPDC094019 TaxID=3364091 RepID=UPI003805AC7A
MRVRALTAVSTLTALTFLGMVPAAQAADSPVPAVNGVTRVEKLGPEGLREMAAAQADANAQGVTDGTAAGGRRVCFQAHARSAGWTSTICTDQSGFTGSQGQVDPIDAVRFSVGATGGMDFNVQLHWANDGTGAEGHIAPGGAVEIWNANGNVLEAIHLWSSNESMMAAAHVKNVGWKGTGLYSYNQWIGSIGEGRWMEAFWIHI